MHFIRSQGRPATLILSVWAAVSYFGNLDTTIASCACWQASQPMCTVIGIDYTRYLKRVFRKLIEEIVAACHYFPHQQAEDYQINMSALVLAGRLRVAVAPRQCVGQWLRDKQIDAVSCGRFAVVWALRITGFRDSSSVGWCLGCGLTQQDAVADV